MLAIVHARAGGGKGLARWRAVEPELHRRLNGFAAVLPPTAEAAREAVRDALMGGEREFIAAGGDGTVNLVIATILQHATAAVRARVRVGAVGLGSSNDFHKPCRNGARVAGVPVRVDFAHTIAADVGRLRYRDGDDWRCRRWILNASIGTTAEGNRLYNDDDAIGRLKHLHPDLGMVSAALRALVSCGPHPMTLVTDDGPEEWIGVVNLGVVKNPHFTGALRYDSPHEPGSGMFHVHLLADVGLAGRARAFARLHRGRFAGTPGTRSWRASRLTVRADRPFAVEGDGEVIVTSEVEFSLDPRALAVCT
jgi:diacylglycerol kinase family enzyme